MRELLGALRQGFPPALLVLLGFVLMVELASFTTIGAAQGKNSRSRSPDRYDGADAVGGRVRRAGVGGLWLRREARGSASAGRADGRRKV